MGSTLYSLEITPIRPSKEYKKSQKCPLGEKIKMGPKKVTRKNIQITYLRGIF
jgi:hypothetical protein